MTEGVILALNGNFLLPGNGRENHVDAFAAVTGASATIGASGTVGIEFPERAEGETVPAAARSSTGSGGATVVGEVSILKTRRSAGLRGV